MAEFPNSFERFLYNRSSLIEMLFTQTQCIKHRLRSTFCPKFKIEYIASRKLRIIKKRLKQNMFADILTNFLFLSCIISLDCGYVV